MGDKIIVHDRVGVQGQLVPVEEESFVEIPEEYYADLARIQELSGELNNARLELGRLMQVIQHLTNVCNTSEKNLANAKRALIDGMGLGEGNWVIDFETNQVGRVVSTVPKVPRVV
jgi:hypothetical protein